jgi:hypothetical protein
MLKLIHDENHVKVQRVFFTQSDPFQCPVYETDFRLYNLLLYPREFQICHTFNT